MDNITRREFLNGMAVALSVSAADAVGASFGCSPNRAPYPPTTAGLRGSHPGSFEVAHALRDGARFDIGAAPVDERFDLIVVGAGISGLSAAVFYIDRRPHARVLVLDSNDDFGGHAKRNEFCVDGRPLLGYGGTQSIEAPRRHYTGASGALLGRLGIDFEWLRQRYDLDEYVRHGMTRGVFFKKELFGIDKLVRQPYGRWDDWDDAGGTPEQVRAFVGELPLSAGAREKLIEMYTSDRDVLAGLSDAERRAMLGRTSTADFMKRYWNADQEILNFLRNRANGLWGLGLESIPAAYTLDLPGFAAQRAKVGGPPPEPYTYHFPDGNASIARLLVARLVPAVAPKISPHNVAGARFDYSRLDGERQQTRIRLNSTAVHVRNVADGVEVAYVERGRLRRAASADAVLACYHCMIPYLLPELGREQHDALAQNVKVPLVYVTLAARNWQPWRRLGVASIDNPGGTFTAMLDFPVSVPGYRFSKNPAEPVCIHLEHEPTVAGAGLTDREQYRAARATLYAMTFADFEREIRDELGRMLGPAGFDFDRDIAAITVNRWPHGYSYANNTLYQSEEDALRTMQRARARVGRISIANADAAYDAYTNAAIDQAYRAATELTVEI